MLRKPLAYLLHILSRGLYLAFYIFPLIAWLWLAPVVFVLLGWIAAVGYLLLPVFVFKMLISKEAKIKREKEITEPEIETLMQKAIQHQNYFNPSAKAQPNEEIRAWAMKRLTYERSVLSIWEIKEETKARFIALLVLIILSTYTLLWAL